MARRRRGHQAFDYRNESQREREARDGRQRRQELSEHSALRCWREGLGEPFTEAELDVITARIRAHAASGVGKIWAGGV